MRILCTIVLFVVGLGMNAFSQTSLPNPDLPIACPYNIVFVLDESGSIAGRTQGSNNVSDSIRNGARDLIAALSGTGSRVAVVEFNLQGRRALVGGTTNYQVVDAAYVTAFNNYITRGTNSAETDHYDPEDYSTTQFYTNWEAAFVQVQNISNAPPPSGGAVDLVIFFTDGDPTAYLNGSNPSTIGSTAQFLNEAVGAANVVKTQGTHIFVVGLPNPNLNTNNIIAISGPDLYPGVDTNFITGDYSVSTSESFRDDLQRIAQSVCKVDLVVDKTASSSACAGENIVFTIILRNNGLDNDTNVVLVDTIPNGFTYISDNGGAATTVNGNILTWNLNSLAGGGGSDTLLVTVGVNASGNHTNRAYASGQQVDVDSTNNQDSFTVAISQSCDDQIPCTRDSCGPGGTCINTPYIVTASISPPTVTICAGVSTTLTASGSGGVGNYTFSWNTGATTASITVSPTTTTSYTVTVTDANRCSASTSRTVTVEQTPTASISPQNAGICNGSSITLTASGGTSYSWNTGETTASITVSPTSTTQYSVTVSNAGGCTASASRNVSVNQSPNVTITPTSAAICTGNSVTLTASGAGGGGSYSWNTGATTESITVSPSVTTNYIVTVTNVQGCSISDTATVTVNPALAVTISPENVSICAGASAILTASGSTTYSWSTGATTSSINVNPSVTTIYSVTASDGSGCSGTASRTVNVTPLPTASISPATVSICPGASAILTASGGTTFSWSTGETTVSITVSPPSTTTYSVTVTDANRCSASTSRQVTVNSSPTAAISPATVAICNGASAALTASGGTSYSWSTGATTATINVNPTSNTNYSVTVTDANGCTASASRQVTVNALPSASISPADVEICVGASATLTASGGTSYSWNTGAATASITVSPTSTTSFSVTVTDANGCTASATRQVTVNTSPSASISPATVAICTGASATLTASGGTSYSWSTGATTQSITVSPTSSTTFSVTVTSGVGCSATASRLVTVNPLPTAAISPGTVAICNGASATLTASGGTSYSWSTGATTASISVNPTSSTSFSVTVTDANGCTASTSRQVTVNPLPVASISPADVSICLGASASLTASGGTAYSWSTGATTASITVSPTATTSFSVTVTDANGCTASASRQVNVNTLPGADISPATVSICNGASATLTASGGTAYSWSTGATTSSITVSPSSSTTYSVTVTSGSGCSATASRDVTVNPLPTAVISPTTVAICNGASATLTASGGASFSWNTGATTSSITVNPTSSTSYSVTVTDANGCTAATSRQVTVNPLPIVSISPSDVTICTGESATLTASGGTSYSWSTGATTTSITVSPASTTSFSVTVTDANGCTASASRQVNVNLLPGASISPATAAICNGASVTLIASGGTSYSWSTGATTASITVNPTTNTTYSVTVTAGTGCSATASKLVTVNSLPTAAISPATAAICIGSSATLTASGGTSYSWNTGDATASITKSPLNSTIYTVTVTDGNGCTASTTRIVTVNPLPVASINVNVSEVCSGENATLTASGGASYSWSTGNTTAMITVTVSIPTSYLVTVTDANGCQDTASAFVDLINCDDGSLCTNDFCVAGACVHTPIPNCCVNVDDCTEGGACAVEACIGNECYYAVQCCDDGDDCTWDYCENGDCIAVQKTCEDNNPCTDNSCINGSCNFPPLNCSDNNVCTSDACVNGVCTHTSIICNDGNPCTTDFCDNGCRYVALSCSDGDRCTRDTCVQGTCFSFPINCNDNNLCTNDACVNGVCRYTPVEIDLIIAKTDVSCGGSASGAAFLLNFAGLPHGAILGEQYAAQGIHIAAQAYPNGNNNTPNVSALVIYDTDISSSNFDLQAGIGNIAIFPTNITDNNHDGNVDNPDDSKWGGKQIFTFDWDRTVCSFLVVDVHKTGGTITAYDQFDNVILSIPLPVTPHSYPLPEIVTVNLNVSGVRKLVIDYKDEGGITDILLDCQSCDGTASVFPVGGTEPYIYHWSNGGTASSVQNLCPGEQCVTVTDANGCSAEECVNIGVEPLNCEDGDPCTVDGCLNGNCTHTQSVINLSFTKHDVCNCISAGLNQICRLDYSGLPHGTFVDEQYALSGIHISAEANYPGKSDVIIFNTFASGTPDPDLQVDIGNIIIIPFNTTDINPADGLVDNPNDNTTGGKIIFTFDSPRTIESFVFVDEENNNATGKAYDAANNLIKSVPILQAGNASVQTVMMNATGVSKLVIQYSESGGVGEIVFGDCNTSCCDGSATVVATGGQLPFTYQWDNGINSGSIGNLCEGRYCVTVTDGNGCQADSCIYIRKDNSPACSSRGAKLNNAEQDEFIDNDHAPVSLNAYPNPFADRLNIEFALSENSRATLEVFNLSGQKMATLFDGNVKAFDKHLLQYLPRTAAEGMVIYRLKTGSGIYYGKAVMVKSGSTPR